VQLRPNKRTNGKILAVTFFALRCKKVASQNLLVDAGVQAVEK
jgi:hypothetical protein